jgi:hypothetical protein
VEKVENPTDRRSFLYKPTMDLLSHLGVSAITDLPDYENIRKNIATFKACAADEATPVGESTVENNQVENPPAEAENSTREEAKN